jgi:hypothetical protein
VWVPKEKEEYGGTNDAGKTAQPASINPVPTMPTFPAFVSI